MTLLRSIEKRCAICGAPNIYDFVISSHDIDGPDLDTRPGNDYRNTMWTWLQECTCCKYVAPDISRAPSIPLDYIESTQYITCEGINFQSSTSIRAYRYYLIKSLNKDLQGAFLSTLWATWACDDVKDTESAEICRKKAISVADEIIKREGKKCGTIYLVRLDLMRRAGMFTQATNEYSKYVLGFEENTRIRQIIDFQIQKTKEQDTKAYRIKDVCF